MRHELRRGVGPPIAQTLLTMSVKASSAATALIHAPSATNRVPPMGIPARVAEAPTGIAWTADDHLRTAAGALKDPRRRTTRHRASPARFWTCGSETSDTQSALLIACLAMSAEGSGLHSRAFTYLCATRAMRS